jgi:glycosyltransferase involved in cell wall biosynthesis
MKRVLIGIHLQCEPERLQNTIASLRANTSAEVEILLLADGPDSDTAAALEQHSLLAQSATQEALGAAACFNRLVQHSERDVYIFLESGSLVAPGWLDHLLSALEHLPNGLAGPSTNLAWNEQCHVPGAGGTAEEIAGAAREAESRFAGQVRTLEPLYSLADFCYAVRREVVEAIGAANQAYGLGPCWEMDYNARAARAGFRGVWASASYVYRSPFNQRRRTEETRRFEASKRHYQDMFCGGRLSGVKTDYRAHCRGDACPNFAPPSLIKISRPFSEIEATVEPAPPVSVPVERVPHVVIREAGTRPLVSCIMPTCDRRDFVSQAIGYFLRQDYPNRELILLDDGAQPVGDLAPEDERVKYIRLEEKLTLGAKRNRACELAKGEIIVHWDDDDWYPARRLSVQVQALVANRADMCGTSRLLFYEPSTDRSWEYSYSAPGATWVSGSSLAYWKSFWQGNRFDNIQVGEDSRFVLEGPSRTAFDLNDPTLCVATVHGGNTCPRQTNGSFWRIEQSPRVREVLGDDFHFYGGMFNPPALPLVSCIMPTFNRRAFIPLAAQSFLSQDYPNKELIIVDDGDDKIGGLVEGIPGVSYAPLSRRASIGAKRNLACEMARGEIIAHWDDDDWYGPNRLRYQIMPILRGEADITGLRNAFVMELPEGGFWTTTEFLHQKMFLGDVHGGTLMLRKDLITEGLRYPDASLAEDAYFLRTATDRGKRLIRLPNAGVFVYVRHGNNAWRDWQPGTFIDPAGWERTSAPPAFGRDLLDAYREAYVP